MRLKKIFPFILLIHFASASAQVIPSSITLPNGWKLSSAGSSLPLGDLPLNICASRTGKYIAVVNCGQSVHSIQLFDVAKERQVDSVILPKAWYGLCFSNDEKSLYASGANDNLIWKYAIINNHLKLADSIVLGAKWPVKVSPAGMALDDSQHLLYVVTKESNQLLCISLADKKIRDSLPLGGEGYTCILSPDKKELYATCWGCDEVKVFNTTSRQWVAAIKVGDNPNEIICDKKGRYLYVCNANDNSVSVIDIKKRSVIETLNAALYPSSPAGSTTNGVALNEKENRLYIANADNNCLAVYDVHQPGKSRSLGFIPTGWYPASVRFLKNKIWVANGKGFTSLPNPYGPNPLGREQSVAYQNGDSSKPAKVQYIASLFLGTMSIIPEPSVSKLNGYSKAVYRNTPYTKAKETLAEGLQNNPIPRMRTGKSPIKYVFYVIKENRTYDQVLADVKGGNGDTSLLLFGEKITPNQHALAKKFVLLDNFYVDAEVSADGHNWSMGGYATDYLEKTWPTSYGGRGGNYSAEGKREIANNKGGFIWDYCKRSGISYRSYGEFADDFKPNIPALKGHICPYFTGFNMSVKDTARFTQWKRDFDSLLSVGKVPQFNTVRFGNDHTDGLRRGRPTPFAHLADNDLAVGLFIEHLSKSSIWKETAVFILEDDAQNGADHLDAHRSPAYLAGGFVKRNFIDHTPYTTTSVLRTIELILGLPPMSQYDAAAIPLWRCFDTISKPFSFAALLPEVNLENKNRVVNQWQRLSETFNLAKEDSAPDDLFNQVIWHAVKGEQPYPGPRRAAFIKQREETNDND